MHLTTSAPSVGIDFMPGKGSLVFVDAFVTEVALERPVIIMCPPTYFDTEITEHSNAFTRNGFAEFQNNKEIMRQAAMEQYLMLRELYVRLGVTVIEITPEHGLYDQVFATDSSKHYIVMEEDGKGGLRYAGQSVTVFAGNYTNAPRQPEEDFKRELLESILPGEHTIVLPESGQLPSHVERVMRGHRYETITEKLEFGDTRHDIARGLIWAGKGVRSNDAAHRQLEQHTGIPVVTLDVEQPFYHMDTLMLPLPSGHILLCEDGLTPESLAKFKSLAFNERFPEEKYLIKVSLEDAMKFACNGVCVGGNVILPPVSQELQDDIRAAGYDVHISPISALRLSGGGHNCMSDFLTTLHVAGGHVAAFFRNLSQGDAHRAA
ncbi:MAG: hypothetical protein J0L97_00750 [Alphaproteobacteria bacterium]|nr:hypothetical protein [Alphaproteobacteria bacterium]